MCMWRETLLLLLQVDAYRNQTALEMIRQHLDDGGFYNSDKHTWRYITNVTYITTLNPNTPASVPRLNTRFLRHFSMFNCPYPKCVPIYSSLNGTWREVRFYFILLFLLQERRPQQRLLDSSSSPLHSARLIRLVTSSPKQGVVRTWHWRKGNKSIKP